MAYLGGLPVAHRHDSIPKRPVYLSKVYSPNRVDRSDYFSNRIEIRYLGNSHESQLILSRLSVRSHAALLI
jgi:hypothetical protein